MAEENRNVDWCKELNLGSWFDRKAVPRFDTILAVDLNYTEAYNIISSWVADATNIPNYVTGTYVLLEAIVSDEEDEFANMSTRVEKKYLDALITFLRLCCPIHSIPTECYGFILGNWACNISHSENYRPNLLPTMYKTATKYCLTWVTILYWLKQVKYLAQLKVEHYDQLKLLRTAVQLYSEIVILNYSAYYKNMEAIQEPCTELWEKIQQFESVRIDPLMTIRTAAKQYLNFIEANLRPSLNEAFSNMLANEILTTKFFFGMSVTDHVTHIHKFNSEKLPISLVYSWNDMIELLMTSHQLIQFLMALLNFTNDSNNNNCVRRTCGLWVFHILLRILSTEIELDIFTNAPVPVIQAVFPRLRSVSGFSECPRTHYIFNCVKAFYYQTIGCMNVYSFNSIHCLLHLSKFSLDFIHNKMTEAANRLRATDPDAIPPFKTAYMVIEGQQKHSQNLLEKN